MSSIMIVNMTPQFGASLSDNSGVVIYDLYVFIIQATGLTHDDRNRLIVGH